VAVSEARIGRILTRSTGYLATVTSHSLQPYRGCSFGNALCGVGCYVRHNRWLTRGEPWGSFLEARVNAAEAYRREFAREREWARRERGGLSIFLSSSTDPFVAEEDRFGITRALLVALLELPPDELVVQTHTHRVARYLDLYPALAARTRLRFHLSIESDRDRLPGLPPPASTVKRRFEAAAALRAAGLRTVITAAPLLPLEDPRGFLERVAASADALVIDHFVGGDGSRGGSRTRRTALPAAMHAVEPASVDLDYRDAIVALAREILPGRVGVGADGFGGRLLP
jgi:DNA repair photolyase